jgi:hypothetical protein
MAETKPARCARQATWIVLAIVAAFAVLALLDAGLPREDRCSYQFPKFLGCVVAKHETLVASLIGLAAALFAAMKAWAAIMRQIESDRKNTRDAERAYVTGGPGRRWTDQDGNHIGIIFTAMNTGRTPAFTTMVYWGICKETDWARVEKDWPRVKGANCEPWDEVLPPGMHPEDRYNIICTATPVPDDGNYVCYGTIVYKTVYGDQFETPWKHRITRVGKDLRTDGLPGGYSSEWVPSPEDQ